MWVKLEKEYIMWEYVPDSFLQKAEEAQDKDEDITNLVVLAFTNAETGEVKFFMKGKARDRGTEDILDELNTE